jgi:hypothetical protein
MVDSPAGKMKSGCLRVFVIGARAMAMLLIFMMVVGLISLWRFPSLAKRNEVDLTDLLIRCIDKYTLDPLHYLQDDRPLAAAAPGFPSDASTVIVTTKKGPHHYEHLIQGSTDTELKGTTLRTTTPHTRIPAEELDRARQDLEKIFPRDDKDSWKQLHGWGKTLFVVWWENLKAKPKVVIEPVDGTDEEHLWFVWKRLHTDMLRTAWDLTNLPELMDREYPKEEDRKAALKWAGEFYDNLARVSTYHVKEFNTKMREARKRLKDPVTLPPRTDWTLYWLLYTHLGLSPESKNEVNERWWTAFRDDRPDLVLSWGQQIRDARMQKGEALPSGGDAITLLCAVQRLTGTDAYGIRCREAFWTEMNQGKRDPNLLHLTIVFGCFPNDDLYYVSASGDSLEVVWELSDVGARLGRLMLFFLLMWGVNGWVFNLLGNRLLKLKDNPMYVSFRDRRKLSAVPPSVFLAYALTPLLAWGLAWFSLPLWIRAQISPARLLVEVYVSVLMGGILFVFLSQTVAVILIRMNVDPETTFLDEIITIPLGGFILLHFGNEIWSIAAFVALSVIPEAILRFRKDDGQHPGKKTGCLMTIGIIALFIAVGVSSEKRRKAKQVKKTTALPAARLMAEAAVPASGDRESPSRVPLPSSAAEARPLPPSSPASPSRGT